MIVRGQDESTDYTVTFGYSARTLEYRDPHQTLRFTFDVSPTAPKTIVLEHFSSATARGDGYSIAFARTKQYLESCGYQVEIYGE